MKVLIVDDEKNCREVLRMYLRLYAECHIAKNGEEAVSLFTTALNSDAPFDLVLMDISMPIMDGQEALQMIRKAEKKQKGFTLTQEKRDYTTIYMITNSEDPAHMIQAYTKGKCNGYLNKPINKRELYGRLKKHGLIPKSG